MKKISAKFLIAVSAVLFGLAIALVLWAFVPGGSEKKDKYDGPEMIAKQDFERTKDPATGKVPRERLWDAIKQTEASKAAARANAASGDAPAALTWIERGPNTDSVGASNGNTRANSGVSSGRSRTILVDANDSSGNTIFVGSVAGGLWKTTDITASPTTWTVVNDKLSNLAVADIAQDTRVGFRNIMYFATGESYYNFDAVRGNGVFKSTDSGATWSLLPSTTSFVNGTRILVDGSGNVYLATRGSGLLRSTDGGTSWTSITPSGLVSDICDLEISSTGRLHVVSGIFSTQAYRFTDVPSTVTSATWTSPTTAFPSYVMRAEIAVSGSTLYAAPADFSYTVPTVYKSTDGGANWAATGGQPTSGWASGQAWYNLSVGINPVDPDQAIVGALDNYKTTDGGTTWTKISAWSGTAGQYAHADQHDIQWYAGGAKLLFANDGGIFYSTDGGATIRDRNVGLRIKQFFSVAIHPSSTNYFLAGAQDNGVHQFSNAGLGSTVEVTGGDGAFVAIDQNEPNYQFGSYVYNVYRRSTDSGSTWSTVSLSTGTGQFINPFDYDSTANVMYCGNSPASYRRWTNPQTGSTNAVISVTGMTGSLTAVAVSPYTANRIYIGTDTGKVLRVDSANTVVSPAASTDLSSGLPVGTISSISFGSTENNIIICFSNYGVNNVWYSTNGGTSWTGIDGNLPDMPVRWAIFKPLDHTKAIIATETGVWETDNVAAFADNSTESPQAVTWTSNASFPNVRTDMIKYRPSDGLLAAATHGRGLWTAVQAPTAATVFVAGRALTSDGTAIRNAIVQLIDANGFIRTARTSSLGYFRFEDVIAGSTCTLNVVSKRYDFAPVVVTAANDISDLDLIAIK